MSATQTFRKRQQWRVYKPKKSNDGAASRLEMKIVVKEEEGKNGKYTNREVFVFWVSAQQTGTDANGNASFGWEDPAKNVTLKLGEPDIGEILNVLNGAKDQAGTVGGKFEGLFHQNEKGSTSFSLKKADNGGYYLRVSKKVGTGAPVIVTHQISLAEGQILKILLEASVRQSYQW